MSRETEWTLFLDETGKFASDPNVAIAGLLLQHEEGRHLRRELRAAIEGAVPGIAYPPHATDLLIPAAHLAQWMAAPPERRQRHPHASRFADVAGKVEARPEAAPGFGELVEELRRRGSAPMDQAVLRRCGAWLQVAEPDFYELLQSEVDGYLWSMKKLLADTAAIFGPARCFMVGAGESRLPEGSDSDRYLELLVPLFERIFALLRSRGGARHKVWISAESRKVRDTITGKQVALRPSDLTAAVRSAEHFPLLAPARPPDTMVRLIPAMPEMKGPDLHPGIVLADFVANRLRDLAGDDIAWERLERGIDARTGLAAAAPSRAAPAAGPLPALAAQGPARRVLLSSLAGETTEGGGADLRWMDEQAARWAAALGGLR